MNVLQIVILAVIQGIAELLPVSSSAHVITAEKLMGLDPTSPEMTLLLVMLHTGTMFAVIVYFWTAWKQAYFSSKQALSRTVVQLAVATVATGIVGLGLQAVIKHQFATNPSTFEIEHLFGNSRLMAAALAAAGLLIIVSSRIREGTQPLSTGRALIIGAVQGLCLPFRGFSRSGATISTGLVCGVARNRAEEFSFALAVVLTPAVIVKEVLRIVHANAAMPAGQAQQTMSWIGPSLLGAAFSFLAGLVALRWLSRWLQTDRWHFFGGYCLVAAAFVFWLGN
ncbi:undecaprenyl-diphosphate phosphatase [Roseateles saccharophilus]|uniref:Undecaprenyl-diphosphatase n=1 Tax=Roseateles saccharophilus TaxID=304 RepID=A0A4R3UPZ1_ROSSA|nr:undecaprenyl-diphosphate phosphatase [Roseateles saccharophilus]MDG0833417.1 undecaprenyl-diphosphate phosphatase [Roseateles saccharophilus]TCU93072.1 undecaprenyl-diphosphatase [Roseateles saccharophilus]